MNSAAEFYDALRTPAFRSVMRELLKAGGWVLRADLEACEALRGGSTLALDNALSDVVMAGLVEWRQGAGYRLVQPKLARDAGRELAAHPELDRWFVSRQRDGQVDVGAAMRLPDGEVVMCALKVDTPAGADVQWAVDAVSKCMGGAHV